MAAIAIPKALLPSDGRFGSGPSKVRAEALAALLERGAGIIGTSHRQAPVRDLVGRVRAMLGELLSLPEGYEIVLGNGGSACFWDIATFCLIQEHSQHCTFGEFSAKFAEAVERAPHLGAPVIRSATYGERVEPEADARVDAYALIQNETSTGVASTPRRPRHADGSAASGLVLVDGTSAAGGMRICLEEVDAYYFAPQKCFGSDGGLWLAALSPAAIERAERLATERYVPAFLDLTVAIDNARLNQTYNTPALVTLLLLADQLEWMLERGGLEWAAQRAERSAAHLYGWAERSDLATPFVAKADDRSPVVGTIDFAAEVDAAAVAKALRDNGVVDTEPYRRLGRNQLRIGMYPTVDPDDVAALTACIDHVVAALA
ncbi:MAG: phosphoserine transaminase [Actinomycetota bacterium]|nr:phosphoserine transaminase [Actinomycetota bacterium]